MRSAVRRVVIGAVTGIALLAVNAPQAPGNHVHCGAIITVDTVLDNDLACPGSAPALHALQIGAPGVTLDLNGFIVTNANSARAAILNPGFEDVTIQNGELLEVDLGILLEDADRNTLRGLRITRRGFGSDSGTGPIRINRSHETRVEGNSLYGWGIALTFLQSDRNIVARNTTGYFLCGMEGRCTNFATGGSVTFQESDDNLIRHNSFSQGIVTLTRGSDRNVLRKNSISYSISTGLVMRGDDNVAVKNTVFGNNYWGIISGGGRTLIKKNVVFDHNRGGGIAAFGESVRVVHNVAQRNLEDGLQIGTAGILVKRNHATDNGDYGIQAVPGVIDGGGNRASGNGNPAQCLNVTCK